MTENNEKEMNKHTIKNSKGQSILDVGLECIMPLIVIFLVILFIFTACSNLSGPETVHNDWDADGDSFDQDDLDSYFEYKGK